MEKLNSWLPLANTAAIIALALLMLIGGNQQFGAINSPNRIPNGYMDTSGGYYVDGVAVISGSGALTIGTDGTTFTELKAGTCNIGTGSAAVTVGAFATRQLDCGGGTLGATAISGIQAGDNVTLHFASTTVASLNSLVITSYSASTTAGFITLQLTNASTSAVTLTSAATSSLEYSVRR